MIPSGCLSVVLRIAPGWHVYEAVTRILQAMMAIAMLLSSPGAAAVEGTLTSAAEVRALSPEEAAKAHPVKIRGFVPFVHGAGVALFLHDGTAGVFVEQPSEAEGVWPATGDRIEVSGVTGQGLFAPVVRGADGKAVQITVLDHGELPPPRRVDGEELDRPDLDCDWIEVEAVVQEVYRI